MVMASVELLQCINNYSNNNCDLFYGNTTSRSILEFPAKPCYYCVHFNNTIALNIILDTFARAFDSQVT